MLHVATLLHDDVVDKSYIRRGWPTINKIWGNKLSVLIGDYMFSKSLSNISSFNNFEHIKILSDISRRLSEGEILQIEHAKFKNMSEDIYFEMISDKTASLISASCKLGYLSVSNDDKKNNIEIFGEYLGIAYQLKDVLFDVIGTIKGAPGLGGGKPGNVSITGQTGGTALSIISTGGENLVVNVDSSARIYGGGGGGEKGKQGDQGASGLCQDTETVQNCGACPDCPDGWTSTSGCYSGNACARVRRCNWWGSCWFETTAYLRYDDCLNEYEVAGGLGGEGGDGGNGRGHGNESGSLQGDIGAQPAPDNGCNSSQGQPGETGGAGGEWALKGADTNNTGDGGAPGRAIAGTSYSVIGSISATTIKGDYPATP